MLQRILKKAFSLSNDLYRDFKEFLSPSVCLTCNGDIADSLLPLCPKCVDDIHRENPGEGPICPLCGRPDGAAGHCDFCSKPDALRLFFWGRYDGLLKDCILHFKFHGAAKLGERLVDMAMDVLRERITGNKYDYIVPVPLHRVRERERDFNQSEIIARRLSDLLGIEMDADTLIRTRSTKQQATLDEKERWSNVKDAFAFADHDGQRFSLKTILLVDDIVTTGATIFEASRPFSTIGSKRIYVFSLTWAR